MNIVKPDMKARPRYGRRSGLGALALAIAVAFGTASGNAQAQESAVHIHIAAQPLGKALLQLGEQTSLQIFYAQDVVKGITAPAVSGNVTPEHALQMLLRGTPIVYKRTGNNITLTRNGTDTVTELPVVKVVGVSGDVTRPYAGGQVARGGRLGLLGDRSVMDTPFNVTSYTAEAMANQQASSVSGVLNYDPSVRSVWSQGSYADEFYIRGFQVLNTDISWDGLYGVLPGQLVGPEYAQRVEVVKGATGLLNGISPSGAIGGAINVVPKRATDDPITSVTATYGSRSQFGTHVDLGRRFGADGEWGVRFNGTFRDGGTAANDQSQRLGVAVLGLDYRSDKFRWSLDAGYQNQRFDGETQPVWPLSGFQIPSPPEASRNFFPSWTYSKSQDTFGAMHAEYDIAPNWTVFGAIGARSNKNQQLQAQPLLLNAAGDLDLGPDYFANRADTTTGQVGIRGSFHTGPVKHELSIAGDYYREEDGFSLYYPADVFSNIYHPTDSPTPSAGNYAFDTPTNAIKKNSSIAIADTASILDGRIQLTFGLRQQRVVADNFDTDSGDLTSHYDKSATSPAVALLVKPLENVSVYANYIQGLQQGPTAPMGAVNAGQVFAPFVAKQYELGTKVDFGRITTTLSLFQIDQPNGVTDPDTLVFGVDGRQRNRGVELNVAGELSRRIRVLGGVTLMDGVMRGTGDAATDGNTAVGVPHTLVNLGAEWDTPFVKNLTLSGLMVYTSSQYVDAANTQKIPAWTRFDVGARYVVHRDNGKRVVLRANIENVFNRAYWAAAAPNYGIALGSPRRFLLSAQFDF